MIIIIAFTAPGRAVYCALLALTSRLIFLLRPAYKAGETPNNSSVV